MRIINIIDRFDKVNFGIWNAAIATAPILKEQFGVDSELWFPLTDYNATPDVCLVALDLKQDTPKELIEKRKLKPENDIIVTHGCWQYPTRWGVAFKKMGFKWVYVPHGMLEPWSLSQKRLQKWFYFRFVERRYARQSDTIRAVGKPEFLNLSNKFSNTVLIPNGSQTINSLGKVFNNKPWIFLFMARLHHKKGIVPLIKAWKRSHLNNNPDYKFVIAGPDDGELDNVKLAMDGANNIHYIGALYGSEKAQLLEKAHFYILPSFSEGFPTSVVEAMSYGLIPLITEGCNFPEIISNGLAYRITTNECEIKKNIEKCSQMTIENIKNKSLECISFINKNYSLNLIAKMQYQILNNLKQ